MSRLQLSEPRQSVSHIMFVLHRRNDNFYNHNLVVICLNALVHLILAYKQCQEERESFAAAWRCCGLGGRRPRGPTPTSALLRFGLIFLDRSHCLGSLRSLLPSDSPAASCRSAGGVVRSNKAEFSTTRMTTSNGSRQNFGPLYFRDPRNLAKTTGSTKRTFSESDSAWQADPPIQDKSPSISCGRKF
jgi:hypothetical protein